VTSGSSALKADHAVGIKPQNLRFEEEVPNDLQGKILHLTENYVLPWLYRFGFEYELKGVLTALFFGAIGLSFLITVIPTVDLAKEKTLAELGRRASFMARQTAEMNAQFLASGFESKVDIGVIKADRTAVFGVLVDMNSRIIAPAEQLNQYLTSGPIAIRVSKISKAMLIDGRETGWVGQVDDLMVAIEPIKTFNPTLQKNIPKALVVVALDTEMSLPQWGAIGTSLSLSILLIGLISTILYFLAYRLILKPIQVLAFDLDKALRGEMNSVTREFKISEMVPVLDLINSVIQRIPKEENGGFSFGSDDHPNKVNVEDLIDSVRGFSEKLNQALLLLNHDGAILFVSTPFEDLSGIRLESSQGQKLSNVGRDQAFGSFIEELLERAKSSGSADDEYEFSGNIYEISVFKMGGATDSPKGYLISAKAKEME
jgi:hypothetical protein